MAPAPLHPTHVWACAVNGEEVTGADMPPPCPAHNVGWLDMGWRVGHTTTNYSWYSTLESAMKDRRCKP